MEVPTFVSVHFVRHKIGVEHYVVSKRDDISGEMAETVTRLTPVKHSMLVNAQALINMARMRLCTKAHEETQFAMMEIKRKIETVDKDLSKFMVANCEYRGRCTEINSCGNWR
jgi:thymidylate synthase ThyX